MRRICLTLLLALCAALPALAAAPVRFRVALAPGVTGRPVSGRLLLFMSAEVDTVEQLLPELMQPRKAWAAAVEIHDLAAGQTQELTPTAAFPGDFSTAPPGDYHLLALLDVHHTFAYFEKPQPGDVRSEVALVRGLNATAALPIEVTLSYRYPGGRPHLPPSSQVVNYESRLLSAFWGRTTNMHAVVQVPPSYPNSPQQRYPVVYEIPGFTWSHLEEAISFGPRHYKAMQEGQAAEMIYVYLDGHFSLGHHVFANSVNNGPWGDALVREFIPYLEKNFRMDGKPRGRLLTGHSSGGWSSLWLQVQYPEFFGGTWSTSPDPVDFRSFTGIDLTREPPVNAYRMPDGQPRNLIRSGGRKLGTVEEVARLEDVLGTGGVFPQTFEAVFSPRDYDGRPMKLFDRETGAIDAEVARAWEKYDISRYLRSHWKAIGPKLRGKLHVWVGSEDNFHLEEAVALLRDALKELGSDARVTILPGRDHFDLFGDGLEDEITRQMYETARPGKKQVGRDAHGAQEDRDDEGCFSGFPALSDFSGRGTEARE